MKKIKYLLLIVPLMFLFGCGDNSDVPIVIERPINPVSINEARTFINDVILEKSDLRQFIKDELLLDFSELDLINDDFTTINIEKVDEALNQYKLSFYHRYSNYKLDLILSLDQEDGQYLIYNADTEESTYEYTDSKFKNIHTENIINLLNDETKTVIDICEHFDESNVLCDEYMHNIRAKKIDVSLFSLVYKDGYFLSVFKLKNLLEQSYISTEIIIGINDEGSFGYDFSLFHENTYATDILDDDIKDDYQSYLDTMIDKFIGDDYTYEEVCQIYFHATYNCLETFDNYNPNEAGSDEDYFLVIRDDYVSIAITYGETSELKFHSFDFHRSETGNIFLNERTEDDYYETRHPSNYEDVIIDELYKYFDEVFSTYSNERFCEVYTSLLSNCSTIKNSFDTLNVELALDNIRYHSEFINPDLFLNYYLVIYTLTNKDDGQIIEYKNYYTPHLFSNHMIKLEEYVELQETTQYFGFEESVEIYKQYILDLGDATISDDLFSQKYESIFSPYIKFARQELYNLDLNTMISKWNYSEINGEPYILVLQQTIDPLLYPTKIEYFRVSKVNEKYLIETPFIVLKDRFYDEEVAYDYINSHIDVMKDFSKDDNEVCSLYEDYRSCLSIRDLLRNEDNAIVYFQTYEGNRYWKSEFIIYNIASGNTLKFYAISLKAISVYTNSFFIVPEIQNLDDVLDSYKVYGMYYDLEEIILDGSVSNDDYCINFENKEACAETRNILLNKAYRAEIRTFINPLEQPDLVYAIFDVENNDGSQSVYILAAKYEIVDGIVKFIFIEKQEEDLPGWFPN